MSETRPTPETPHQPTRPNSDNEMTMPLPGRPLMQDPQSPQPRSPQPRAQDDQGYEHTQVLPTTAQQPQSPQSQSHYQQRQPGPDYIPAHGTGQPFAGGGQPPSGPEQPQSAIPQQPTPKKDKKGRGKTVVAAVLAAGLIGGGVGASATALLDKNEPALTSQSGSPTTGKKSNAPAPVAPAGSVQEVANKVLPSVVSISVGNGSGSGIILSADGRILTNNHVAEAARQGATMTVQFNDGKTAQAKVVGLDSKTDLAIIQAEGVSGLTPIQIGSSGGLAVGQQVVAIGSPLGLSGTVTSGIVSALDRPVATGDANSQDQTTTVIDAIQTDAAINPGNSGGALVDMAGRLVGINSAIATVPSASGGQSGNIGVGFAIPIDEATPIADQLTKKGSAEHAQIGVALTDTSRYAQNGMDQGGEQSKAPQGALVGQVNANSPAQKAGLQAGDIVTKVDDRRIADANGLIAAVRSYRPGNEVTLTYTRSGEEKTVKVQLESDAGSN